MAKNLKYQFNYAINNACKMGADKHSMKGNKANSNVTKIVSYSDRKNMIDVSANFANWMKENHDDIKELKDITSTHVQEFLDVKAKTCTDATVDQYRHKFTKLEQVVNETYTKANVTYTDTVMPVCTNNTEQLRTKMMDESDYNKLHTHMSNNCRSDNGLRSLELGYHAGLRVSECAKLQQRDININTNGTATVTVVDGKGARDREIYITNKESVQVLANIRDSVENPTDRLVSIQHESINKAINRAMDACDMKEYKLHDTSVHSLRKAFAQREYDTYKEQGLEPKQAWDKVSELLGHGKNRDDLYKVYVSNK